MNFIFSIFSAVAFLLLYTATSYTAYQATKISNQMLNASSECEDWLNLSIDTTWPCIPDDLHQTKDSTQSAAKSLLLSAAYCIEDSSC
jgi:hypothetical protein